ncbi:glycosyl hydrolase [Actinacidiphila yeochonensis]|uniref:glycosyl hydrolase n=1 Tax=Actinacidiphila yeochonensis TaxID=89050 RepID=UPI0007C6CED0|nr:glycosyl hydrolase [Actinacidiphila yeochonensis]
MNDAHGAHGAHGVRAADGDRGVHGLLPAEMAAILEEPPRAFSPAAIWWWSGERLERARLRAQLERFAEGGVFNLVVLNLAPSGPLFGSDADDPAFMSDGWWALLDGVCEDAAELGVLLWFYDQLGFSGADLQARLVDERPRYGGRALERVRAVVDGDGELGCPAHGQPVGGHAEPLDAAGRVAGPAVPLAVDGRTVRPPGPGRWRLTLHHHVARGFDYLGAEACAALVDRVHGAFERHLGDRLGTVVVGSFQDELPSLPTWSARFAEEFLRLRGYDLLPRLDALYEDGASPDAARVRHDYQLTRAELAEAAFFRPLADWHRRHGLLAGCDQQDPARAGHPVGGVELYADYARTHRWFSAPGSDHHGDARVHSSLAHLYGGRRTWIEAFHSTGWGGTLEETFDWLLPWLRAGATLYNPHAVYYTTKGGWWEWAPPGTDWRQPYWRHHRAFADAVTRLCAVLSLGHHLCDLAVLLPTTTAQAGTALDGVCAAAARAQAVYLELVGDMTWFTTRPGVLDRLGRDADVIDDASLARAAVRGGGPDGTRLCVAEERYATVLLPACAVLEADVARRLVEFASAGGRVVALGAVPEEVVGTGAGTGAGADTGGVLAELRACFADGRAVFVPTAEELAAVLTGGPAETRPAVEATVPVLARRAGEATVVFLTAAAPRATRAAVAAPDERGAALGWLDARYDFDPGRYAPAARVRVRGVAGPAVLLDPFGGAPRVLPVRVADDESGCREVEVPFDAGPAALLVFPGPREQPPPTEAAPPAGTGRVVVIPADADWETRLVPTADNTWGDFARPAAGPDGPARTELRTFRHRVEGPGEDGVRDGWALPGSTARPAEPSAHATFGPHAVLRGADGEPSRTLEWSDSRGIRKDPVHRQVLGPKGHVPEEFIHLGPSPAGVTRRVATELLLAEDFDGHLAIGAAAAKSVRLAGRPVELEDGGHLALGRVRSGPGRLLLELDLTPGRDVDLRAHVALVRDADRYRRPEWISAAGSGADSAAGPAAGPGAGAARVGTTLTLAAPPARAVVQVAARGRCVLRVNGVVVGRQGGFDPYAEHAVPRVRRYDVAAVLRAGDNEIAVETGGGDDPAVLVDAVLHGDGSALLATAHSDATWWAERGGERVPPAVHREPAGDPAALYLRRRPHPLPGAAWLDPDADDGTVLPVGFAVPGARPPVEWLWFELPPGAARLTMEVHGRATVFVDGAARGTTAGGVGPRTLTVGLADGAAPSGVRSAALRLEPAPGHEGGAALAGPVRCEAGPGRIRTGEWESNGLAEYSGGVRYRRVVDVPAEAGEGRVLLDLGRVRGTAEVSVGGASAGVRVCSPYVFDLTGLAAPGPNTVDVTVFGTLAPWLDAASPTHFVFPGQRVTGLLGPVRLLTGPDRPAAPAARARPPHQRRAPRAPADTDTRGAG